MERLAQGNILRVHVCIRLFLPLHGLSPRGTRVVLARPALRDPSTTDMNDATQAMLLMVDVLLAEDEGVAITGVELVMDAGAMTFQHAAQMNPVVIKKASTIMQVKKLLVIMLGACI